MIRKTAKKSGDPFLLWTVAVLAFLMIFAAPLQEISYYWKFSITGYRVFLVLTLLAGALLYWKQRLKLPATELALPVVFFLHVALLSMSVSLSPGQSVRMIFILITAVLGFYVVVWLAKDTDWLLRLVNAYLVAAFVSAAYGIFQLIAAEKGIDPLSALYKYLPAANPVLREPLYKYGAIGNRIDAFLGDPNFLAGFMVAALFLSAGASLYYFRLERGMLSGLGSLLALLFFTVTLLTYSRSGLAGLFIAAAVTVLYGWRLLDRRFGLRTVVLVFAAVLLFYLVVLPIGGLGSKLGQVKSVISLNWGWLAQTFGAEDGSTEHHLRTGWAGFKMLAGSPLIGVGIGNYGEHYAKYFIAGQSRETSHSSYILFFAESGVLGGLGLLWVITVFLLTLFKTFKRLTQDEPESALILGLLAGSAGLLTANIFYYYLTHEYVWLYFGLAVAATRSLRDSEQ